MLTRFLACLCLLLASMQLRAECQCLWQGSFTQAQAQTDLVVSGTVIATKGNSIDQHSCAIRDSNRLARSRKPESNMVSTGVLVVVRFKPLPGVRRGPNVRKGWQLRLGSVVQVIREIKTTHIHRL